MIVKKVIGNIIILKVNFINSIISFCRLACVCFGAVGVFLAGLMIRRYLRDRKRRIEETTLKKRLEETRRERRKKMRDIDLPESQLCVVCRQNPREIILLPCGHVCLCEDCADGIHELCPVCRKEIEMKSAAYIA